MKLPALPKTEMKCYTCRRVFAEIHWQYCFPTVYDFCPDCESLMLYDFARQMVGLPARALTQLKKPKELR